MLEKEQSISKTPMKAAKTAAMEESPSVHKKQNEADTINNNIKHQHHFGPRSDVTFGDLKVCTPKLSFNKMCTSNVI